MKRILTIQDISCVGKCSLTVALPIISAFGIEAGILPKAAIAKKALNNLYGSIVYLDGAEMKSALVSFYTAIGMYLPNDEIYYEK